MTSATGSNCSTAGGCHDRHGVVDSWPGASGLYRHSLVDSSRKRPDCRAVIGRDWIWHLVVAGLSVVAGRGPCLEGFCFDGMGRRSGWGWGDSRLETAAAVIKRAKALVGGRTGSNGEKDKETHRRA